MEVWKECTSLNLVFFSLDTKLLSLFMWTTVCNNMNVSTERLSENVWRFHCSFDSSGLPKTHKRHKSVWREIREAARRRISHITANALKYKQHFNVSGRGANFHYFIYCWVVYSRTFNHILVTYHSYCMSNIYRQSDQRLQLSDKCSRVEEECSRKGKYSNKVQVPQEIYLHAVLKYMYFPSLTPTFSSTVSSVLTCTSVHQVYLLWKLAKHRGHKATRHCKHQLIYSQISYCRWSIFKSNKVAVIVWIVVEI